MPDFVYVDNQNDLEDSCLILESSNLLSVDTEFVRERTFYPQPGLFQVSDGKNIYLIDPLGCENLQPFFHLLESNDIQIVMHSSSEDIELFYTMGCGTICKLFDTQIASAWLGMGQSLSLQKLVEHYEKVLIEKQLSRTNWLKRPLSDAQLEYAAIDVLYLNSICKKQEIALRDLGFYNHMIEDCDLRCEKKSMAFNDELAYLKVKRVITATGDSLSRLQKLAAWREQVARKDDKPRQHVIKDLQLLSICINKPESLGHLDSECEVPHYIIRKYGNEILKIITKEVTDQDAVNSAISLRSLTGAGKTLNDCRDLMVDINRQQNIPREVLPSKRWLEQFLLHYVANWYPQPDGWKGWRKTLLEKPILKLIETNQFSAH